MPAAPAKKSANSAFRNVFTHADYDRWSQTNRSKKP